ncbi:sensor histidine kinase [Bdellovibrio sp. HCB2-146]|uniref:sensor histidine kinase n=1 Tax=Bdellovibrio sp. HCB2-146 TaxID=3394362 RepID=UPI0039BCAA65
MNPIKSILGFFNFGSGDQSPEKARLFWLVRMRWLFMALVLILSPIGWMTGFLDRTSFILFMGVLGLLFVLNFVTQAVWLDKSRKVSVLAIHGQLMVDLVVLTGLLLLSGGLTNPFWILLFINIVLGALLLSADMALLFQIACHLSLFVLQIVPITGDGNEDVLLKVNGGLYLVQHLVLLMMWAASRSFGRYLHQQQKSLLQVQVFAEKMDRLRALGALTAGFSHEFASPLNTLKLRVDREVRNQGESTNLQEMKKALQECEAVIRQMNSAQMDPREYRFQVFDLVSCMQDLLDVWKRDHKEAQVQIQSLQAPHWVKLPQINFAQMFLNLLDNAYEASGTAPITIEFTDHNESHLKLIVKNQNSFFDKDVLVRFGEPFVTTKATGTGLGLYTAHLFMQSLGGTIKLQNQSDGAAVELLFPKTLSEKTPEALV